MCARASGLASLIYAPAPPPLRLGRDGRRMKGTGVAAPTPTSAGAKSGAFPFPLRPPSAAIIWRMKPAVQIAGMSVAKKAAGPGARRNTGHGLAGGGPVCMPASRRLTGGRLRGSRQGIPGGPCVHCSLRAIVRHRGRGGPGARSRAARASCRPMPASLAKPPAGRAWPRPAGTPRPVLRQRIPGARAGHARFAMAP